MAYYKYIKKIKEPTSPPMQRGSDIHKDAELWATKQLKKRPPSLDLFDLEFDELRKISKKLQVEAECAVDASWNPCSWFGAMAWMRAKLDVMFAMADGTTLKVIDYKTGKIRAENMEQLDLYAILGFIFGGDHITKVEAEFWYLDEGGDEGIQRREYTRADALKLRKVWEKRTKKMLADVAFKPTPSSNACRWCWFSQKAKNDPKRGGPGLCKF